MVFGEGDQEVEALAAEGPDEPLAESVGFWSEWRSLEDLDAEVLDGLSDFGREQDVAVEDRETVGMFEGNGISELLGNPLGRWMGGEVEVKDSARLDLHDDEDVKELKPCGDDGEKVCGDDGIGVVSDEGCPYLRALPSTTRVLPEHVLADGAC